MRIRKIVFLFLAGLCVLQVMLLYLEYRSLQKLPTGKTRKVHRELSGHSRDSSGRYLVHYFYKSEGFGLHDVQPEDVTLVTHCTVDRLHHIIGLVETWAGPMSISIFAPGTDAAFADDVIDGLRLCWPQLRQWATFHLVYPKDKSAKANMTGIGRFAYYSCKDISRKMILRKLDDNPFYVKRDSNFAQDVLPYPHNLMRNVALKGVLTDFVMSIDVELTPSGTLRTNFKDFAIQENLFSTHADDEKSRGKNDIIYVLPAFEVRQDEETIGSKESILQAIKKNSARPLLQETCGQCHKSTNYEQWTSSNDFADNFGVQYKATFTPGWEPYFIASRNTPRYDENIASYGQDRLSKICDLNARNYSFAVLNKGFLVKRTFKSKSTMTKSERSRRDDRGRFHQMLRLRLRESGKIPTEAVKAC